MGRCGWIGFDMFCEYSDLVSRRNSQIFSKYSGSLKSRPTTNVNSKASEFKADGDTKINSVGVFPKLKYEAASTSSVITDLAFTINDPVDIADLGNDYNVLYDSKPSIISQLLKKNEQAWTTQNPLEQ